MIELRWIKMKNWEFGKFKLQVRNEHTSTWIDVPVVEKSQEWCSHIKLTDFGRDMTIDGVLMPASRVVYEFNFCPICGTPKPKDGV